MMTTEPFVHALKKHMGIAMTFCGLEPHRLNNIIQTDVSKPDTTCPECLKEISSNKFDKRV